ncbi:hypothetical protein NDU88_010668 [Pleurodeles waltl]|uniref:Uncharacterized protein n=1 Tax=Pleurodeles waltl TaxID=8319 RepID=A0AAV7QX16_PLEWA|nr:hypothetical protein NDU88_010668 [Pleurodeles waltl]
MESLTRSQGDAAERKNRESITERLTGSRGDGTDEGGAGAQHGDPEINTSGAGGAQQEFQPRLGKSMAFPATDPPDSLTLYEPAAPDPEGDCVPSNPLTHPGAEGQSQRLRTLPLLKLESEGERQGSARGGSATESLTGSQGDAAERKKRESTTERLTGSRGDATDDGGAGAQHGDPEINTSGARDAQREFQPRLGKSVAFPGAWQT